MNDVVQDMERAHLRLLAIQEITHNRIPEAQLLLAQVIASNPQPVALGVCRFCGCTSMRPCGMMLAGGAVVTCAWIDADDTVCSSTRCIEKWQLLRPEFVQTSAGLVLP